MTTKHTPGPWSYRQQANGAWCVEKSSTIAHVYGKYPEANASLIAAAPDMLAALAAAEKTMRELIEERCSDPEQWPEYQAIQAAIAKATGSAA